jgi:MerR family copper efflux transcriptional regulator
LSTVQERQPASALSAAEEVGLAPPSARSRGGFRLYTDDDASRLLMIKRMKPLDFSLEQMRDLLDALDELPAGPPPAAVLN